MIPVSNELKRNIVPSRVKEIIFAKIFPINSNPVEIKGTLRIKIAKSIWIPNPFPTNNQSISCLFLLNKKAISNKEIIPNTPLKMEFMLIPDVAIIIGSKASFLKVKLILFSFKIKDVSFFVIW